jgi:hypothetical protein
MAKETNICDLRNQTTKSMLKVYESCPNETNSGILWVKGREEAVKNSTISKGAAPPLVPPAYGYPLLRSPLATVPLHLYSSDVSAMLHILMGKCVSFPQS